MTSRDVQPGAYRATGTLLIAWIIAYLDRQSMNLLIPSLKSDLALSDTQISLVQGLAFALLFSLAGLVIGRAIDRGNRRNILALGIATWSIMTIACGMSSGFWGLFLARMGVGVGQACLAPATFSLLADFFASNERGRASGAVVAGGSIGSAAASALSGWILQTAGDTHPVVPLLGAVAPWQLVFFVFGFPGLLAAALMLTVREPARQEVAADVGTDTRAWIAYLQEHRPVFVPLYAAFTCHFVASYGVPTWGAVVLMRVNRVPPAEVGYLFGAMLLVLGPIAAVLGGVAGDWLASRWPANGRLRLVWLTSPPMILALLAFGFPSSVTATVCLIGLTTFVSGGFVSACYPILSDLVPNQMRGQAVALFMLLGNMAGLGLTPTLIALVTDYGFGNDQMVRQSIVAVCLPAAIGVLVLCLVAMRPYARLRSRMLQL